MATGMVRRRRGRALAPWVLGLMLLTVGGPRPAGAQAMPADVGAGRIAWFDLSTSNLAKSRAFYGDLFGWQFAPVQGTDQAAEIVAGGASIGTLRVADGPIGAYNGVVYVQVAGMAGIVAKAKALGGTVLPGFPFNLPGGRGAIALVVEPGGHPIGLYDRSPLP
jgi:predicted enzyme related to lactoylglutathione lyase